MPATRSRTEHWKESLLKIHERGGGLEISVARNPVWLPTHGGEVTQPASDVVWRVRILRIGERDITVESPGAFGETIKLKAGLDLIGAITVGQNRWMFHTRTIEQIAPVGSMPGRLVLTMPEGVERCTRRNFFRISTANLNLPDVTCWPLLDPCSVVGPEAANRTRIEDAQDRPIPFGLHTGAQQAKQAESEPFLPEVGPAFKAKLVNISGGGLGLRVAHSDSAGVNQKPFLWLNVDLRPEIAVPLAVTTRIAHTHMDSSQFLYVGLAFDFAYDPEHRPFIVEQFEKYVQRLVQKRVPLTEAC